jgi:hypothetical protein
VSAAYSFFQFGFRNGSPPTLHSEFPLAQARLAIAPGGETFDWLVDCCPICGRSHCHGGGLVGEDPRRMLGHRARHCRDLKRATGGVVSRCMGYILVDANPTRTLTMLREIGLG